MHLRGATGFLLAAGVWTGLSTLLCGRTIVSNVGPDGAKVTVTSPFEDSPEWAFAPMNFLADTPPRGGSNPWRAEFTSRDYSRDSVLRAGFNIPPREGDISRGSALVVINVGNRSRGANYVMVQVGRNGRTSNNSFGGGSRNSLWITTTAAGHGGVGFDPANAPGDWRAYAGFTGIQLTAADWSAMPPSARTAVHHWVRLGGRLHLRKGQVAATHHGPREVDPDVTLAKLGLPPADSGQPAGPAGRGRLSEGAASLDSGSSDDDWFRAAISGRACESWKSVDPQLFKARSVKGTAGFMLFVVVVFAVVVGPLNVFLLAGARRRYRLFLTTPLISLGAGGLLVVSVVLSDGLGGKGQRYVWLESGPDNIHYVVQHQHSRCGAMFGTQLEIPEDAYFAPANGERPELNGNLTVDLLPGKVRGGGAWFASRGSQTFFLAAARPSRGRIEQSGTPERPRLTSAFEFPLERVFWLAPDGKTWWQASDLRQGTATDMTACTAAEVEQAVAHATVQAPAQYGKDLHAAVTRPGYFFALADNLTAIETNSSIRWRTRGFVTGRAVAAP